VRILTQFVEYMLNKLLFEQSSNKKSTVVGFIYKHIPFNTNFSHQLVISYILTSLHLDLESMMLRSLTALNA